jgi:hypothetical protein
MAGKQLTRRGIRHRNCRNPVAERLTASSIAPTWGEPCCRQAPQSRPIGSFLGPFPAHKPPGPQAGEKRRGSYRWRKHSDEQACVIALQYIHGIGPKFAKEICSAVNIAPERRVNELTDAEVIQIRETIDPTTWLKVTCAVKPR